MRWITGPRIVVALSIAVLASAAAYSALAPMARNAALDALTNQKSVSLEGVIAEEPDVRASATLLTLDVKKINGNPGAGRVLVSASPLTQLAYGDRVVATGKIERPAPFATDFGRVFDYPKYLATSGITHVMPFGSVHVIAGGEGNPFVAALLSVKHVLERGIAIALPEPESSLAGGLLLGDKQSLGDSITQAFRRAGDVHIIVLSGYNVSVIIDAILFIALYVLPKRCALALAALAAIAFTVMTGASETTIRAAAMALIVLLAKGLNRPAEGLRILLIVAAGMALWNPYLVLYNLSYQLSILATLGLILFSGPIKKRIPFVTDAWGFREIVSATVATQLTVLPLLVFSVGQVSLVSLATNILVLPVISFSMLVSFIAALLALVSYWLAFPATAVAYALLHYVIAISVWLGNLPFAVIQVPLEDMSLWLATIGLVYALAALFFVWRFKRTRLRA
ncbi:MAG: ComEC family competence protein [Patescibacteria group bacterium]|nr:ComEC family competence protein [Patescibacteria group bacterium]